MSVRQRDAVFLSGFAVFYSYDPGACAEAREIEQLKAVAMEGHRRWGPGTAVAADDIAHRPADFPSPYLWLLPDDQVPWEEDVRVHVGRATAEVRVAYTMPADALRAGDRARLLVHARRAIQARCVELWGPGAIRVIKGEIQFRPRKGQ